MAVELFVEATRPHDAFVQNWGSTVEPAIQTMTATDCYFGRLHALIFHPRMKFEVVTKSCPRPFTWVWFEDDHALASAPEVVILFLHGGGHWAFTGAMHFEYVGRTLKALQANGLRCRACVLDTRRAPEHPWPAALEDAIATYDWLQKAVGVDHSRIVFAGDSAGGGLCVCLLKATRDSQKPQPLCSLVVSPLTDLSRTADAYPVGTDIQHDFLPAKAAVDSSLKYFRAGENPQNPLISPKFGELHALSPILIQAGASELLARDAIELARRLDVYRGQVALELYPEMPHVFPMFACLGLEDGRTAINRQAAFVREQLLGKPSGGGTGGDGSLSVSVHDGRTRSFENVRSIDDVARKLPSIASSPTFPEALATKRAEDKEGKPKRRGRVQQEP